MNTIENNKLIAEFMGYKFYNNLPQQRNGYQLPKDKGTAIYLAYSTSELQYHTSWDWLMPVVEKIEYIESITHGNQFQVMICEEEVGIYDKHTQTQIVCIPTDGESKLTNTYKAVVEFIKQYNK